MLPNISTVCNAIECFDKKLVLALYNSLLKIYCDKVNHVDYICIYSFQKKMLSNLTFVLIYSSAKCALQAGLLKNL